VANGVRVFARDRDGSVGVWRLLVGGDRDRVLVDDAGGARRARAALLVHGRDQDVDSTYESFANGYGCGDAAKWTAEPTSGVVSIASEAKATIYSIENGISASTTRPPTACSRSMR